MDKVKLSRSATRYLQSIVIAASLTLGACADIPRDTPSAAAHNQSDATAGTRSQYRARGKGRNYEWGKDHIFVKLSNAETGGLLTLIEDNLKPGFDLGLHVHHKHTEIFYILDGEVEFVIADKSVAAGTGAIVYLPAGTPHAARSPNGGKMLMFYSPGGFDEMLAEIDNTSWFQRLNPMTSIRRNRKYDIHSITGAPEPPPTGPAPRFLAPGEGKRVTAQGNQQIEKLSNTDTSGLGSLSEISIAPGNDLPILKPGADAQIVYVLDGNIRFAADGKTQLATSGDTIYSPPGKPAEMQAVTKAKLLVYRALPHAGTTGKSVGRQ